MKGLSLLLPGSRSDGGDGTALEVQVFPGTGAGRRPVIVFSHGHLVDPRTYFYLGMEWARRGFTVFHPQHTGPSEKIARAENWPRRSADLLRVLKALGSRAALGKGLADNVDPRRVGVAGHSMGAHTALLLGGAALFHPSFGREKKFRIVPEEARNVKACLVLSPPPEGKLGLRPASWRGIRCPLAIFSGSRDFRSPDGRITGVALQKSVARPDTRLFVFKKANHLSFINAVFKEDDGRYVQFPDFRLQGEARRFSSQFWKDTL